MSEEQTLHKKIVDFLISLPNIHESESQQALIYHAGVDPQLQSQIQFGKSPAQFFPYLVSTLRAYGRLSDGRDALEAILEAAKDYIGKDKRAYSDTLIKELRNKAEKPINMLDTPSAKPTPSVSPVATTTKSSPILHISSISDLSQNEHLSWLPIRVEKDLVRLFANVGIKVLSALTFSEPSGYLDYEYEIEGVIHQENAFTILSVYFTDRSGQIVSTGELKGDVVFFERIKSVLCQALIYALDLDVYSLNTKNTKRKPTSSTRAYSIYLLAKKELTEEKEDIAISLLEEAIAEDPQFAMACWTLAQIYYERNNQHEGNKWERKAKDIDPDHPRWSYIDPRREQKPFTELLQESNKRQFEFVEPGISYKIIEVQPYTFEVGVWLIELTHYEISVILQKDAKGNFIDEFIQSSQTVLALNGTPFEMDTQYRLSPTGLLMNQRRVYHPATEKGGSGIFLINDNKPDIISSKQLQDPKDYDFAIQSGPILVESGGILGIYSNNYERCNRSAIGVCGNKVALVIATGAHGEALSLYEFAQFLRTSISDGGIGCDVALNLDGGPSSQINFKYKKHQYRVKGLWPINNAIVISSKS